MAESLGFWIVHYLDYLRIQKNASPHTLRNYASDLQQFLDYLTHTPEGELRPEPEPDHPGIFGRPLSKGEQKVFGCPEAGDFALFHEIPFGSGFRQVKSGKKRILSET
jgi:hypothetical protein